MFSGVSLAQSDIADGITAFFGIGAVIVVLGTALALRFVPKLSRALYSLMGRR